MYQFASTCVSCYFDVKQYFALKVQFVRQNVFLRSRLCDWHVLSPRRLRQESERFHAVGVAVVLPTSADNALGSGVGTQARPHPTSIQYKS